MTLDLDYGSFQFHSHCVTKQQTPQSGNTDINKAIQFDRSFKFQAYHIKTKANHPLSRGLEINPEMFLMHQK